MPRLAANLSYLFTERPFLDRFEAAARCGFRAMEHQFPYQEASESAIRGRLRDHDLRAVLFNLPPGEEGERGLGGLPGRESEFREGLSLALHYCRATGCPRLHAMWGVPSAGTSLEESRATFVANLREAAPARGRGRCHPARGAAQSPRQSRLSAQSSGRCACARRRGRRSQRQGAVRPLSLPDRRGRRGGEAQALAGRRAEQCRAHPDRGSAGPARARCGGSSTTRGCSRSSTSWDTRDGSVASTGRRQGPRRASAGRAGGGSGRLQRSGRGHDHIAIDPFRQRVLVAPVEELFIAHSSGGGEFRCMHGRSFLGCGWEDVAQGGRRRTESDGRVTCDPLRMHGWRPEPSVQSANLDA